MAKTLLDRWQDDAAAPQGGTFLERALERALGRLDGDPALPEDARQAAKAALAAALTAEIREVLGANRPRAAKTVTPTPVRSLAPARPFAWRPEVAKPGYFREPSQTVGISDTACEVRLTGGTATWLRVAPAWDFGRTWTCAELKAALRGARPAVLPIFADAGGIGRLTAPDGMGVYAGAPGQAESSGVVLCFRSGEIWSVDAYVQDALAEQRPSPGIQTFEPQLTAAFEAYVGLLQRLGAPGPYRWVVGMDGLAGRSMALAADGDEGEMAGLVRGDCLLNTVQVEGEYEPGAPFEAALQPFFDELCRACSTPVG